MLLTEILSSDEMKEIMTSFNKVSSLHPRKEAPDVQEIKEKVHEVEKLARVYQSQPLEPAHGTLWGKAFS